MVNFFVLDDGDVELGLKIDESGEEIYSFIDRYSSSESIVAKKFKKFDKLSEVEKLYKDRLCVCKVTGYPEVCLNSVNGFDYKYGSLVLGNWERFELKDDLVVFKAKDDLFIQPLMYSRLEEGEYICYEIEKDLADDETKQLLKSPKYSFTTSDIKSHEFSSGHSWRIILNMNTIEIEPSTYGIIEKYNFEKFVDIESGISYLISKGFENISDIILKETFFTEKILTLLEVKDYKLSIKYNFDEPFSGWVFTAFPFISFIYGLSCIRSTSISGRIVHLSQSSGHGKTRLCFELLKYVRLGIYCVYRGNSLNGFPKTTPLSKDLFDYFEKSQSDLYSTIICAKFILFCIKNFKTINDFELDIFKGLHSDKAAEMKFTVGLDDKIGKEEILNHTIAEISATIKHKLFPIVFDECHEMLATPKNRPEAINLYRAMRRVLFLLKSTKIVAIFLSTKTSLSDFFLNHHRDPSIRELVGDKKDWIDVPCYVYTQNVDSMFTRPYIITFKSCSFIKIAGGAHMSHPKCLREIATNLGRPLWNGYSFDYAIKLALEKLKTDGKLFELTSLILRTGSQVVPQDELAHKLVLSGMATLLHVDIDGSRCWVEYIPEPILSNAARIALTSIDSLAKAVKEYLRRLQIGSFHDSGYSGELVARIALLRVMDLSVLKQKVSDKDFAKFKDIESYSIEDLFGKSKDSFIAGSKFLEKSRKIFYKRESCTEEFYSSPPLSTVNTSGSAGTSEHINEPNLNPPNFSFDTIFLSPFIGVSTVREYLMFLSDLDDDATLWKLGVSDNVLDGFVYFNQFVKMENPLIINQQYLLHFYARSCAMILPHGAKGADLIIPVLRTDNQMSCIVIQVKNYGVMAFPYKSAETVGKLTSSYLKFLNFDAVAGFEKMPADDFIRIVIQFCENAPPERKPGNGTENSVNVALVEITPSLSHSNSQEIPGTIKTLRANSHEKCHALWLRGLNCFESLFFGNEGIIDNLNIILNGERDFLSGIQYPEHKLPTLLQTSLEGARFLANSARTLVSYDNVVVHDAKLRDKKNKKFKKFKKLFKSASSFEKPRKSESM